VALVEALVEVKVARQAPVEQVLRVKALRAVILVLVAVEMPVAHLVAERQPQVQIDPIQVVLINLMVVQELYQQY
jgi:hypothetical protein